MRTIVAIAMSLILISRAGVAAPPRVLPAGQLPDDARLKPPKDYDGYFPFTPPKNVDEWNARAERVRRQMLVAFGLWPMPEKTPLNGVIHGKIDRPEYTVEKVSFESYPGFYVTGSLYRPKNAKGKVPGVLVPHGHHNNGRFNEESVQSARNQIAEGAERWENGGRYPLQAMCVTLARMGCVAFLYDMIGYADSTQLSFELVHRHAKERPDMDQPSGWGFFSKQAELRCQSVMGVQTYNSIRALDWLSELPDVDAERIGVTGASGGGTQTMILAALDPRVTAAVPVVMVSTAMQGGCTCESSSLLRVDTGNIEFAALYAPKPQVLVAANDWTKELGTKGLPELKQHYDLLGAPKNIDAKLNLHFPHNYNFVSREVMYQWFNKYLKLGLPEPVLEDDFQPLTVAEASVWDGDHPRPSSGDDFERAFTQQMAEASDKQIAALAPTDTASLAEYRRVVGGAFETILGYAWPAKDDVTFVPAEAQQVGQYFAVPGLLRQKSIGSEVPMLLLSPDEWNVKRFVVWIDGVGKQGLFGDDGQPKPAVRKLLDNQIAVIGLDLYLQGEFLADGKPPADLQRVANPREFLGYTLGYNYAPFAQRVRDVVAAVAYLRQSELEPDNELYVVGVNGGGPIAAAASAMVQEQIDGTAIDTAGFRFADIPSLWSIDMLPGAIKYGGLPGLLSLIAPKPLCIAGEGAVLSPLVAAVYKAAENSAAVKTAAEKANVPESLVEWTLDQARDRNK